MLLRTVASVGKLHFFPDGNPRYRRILVDGKSMHPTYENGLDAETIWMHTLEYTSRAPQRGDVVVLGNEANRPGFWVAESPFYLKRIIGLPGEHPSKRSAGLVASIPCLFGVGC